MKPVACAAFVVFAVTSLAGTVTNVTVRSRKMDKDVPVTVLLPAGYERGDARYPSVYLLHWAGGSHAQADDSVLKDLADLYGVIVIAPDGERTCWWLDSPIDPKFQYETFVVKELLPFADKAFRTVPNRKRRGIMGGSMGGHGACYLGFRHKNLFGVVGNIFGGVDLVPWSGRWDIDKRLGPFDRFPERWAEHSVVNVAKTLTNGDVDLICALGTEDFFLGCNRQLHDLLSVNGVAHTYVEVRTPSHLSSVHGNFYHQGVELCFRFIANYFRDEYGHLGDVRPN